MAIISRMARWKLDWTDLKESKPVELAEYAVANKIIEELAFKWWVATVLRRRNWIISKLKSWYWGRESFCDCS